MMIGVHRFFLALLLAGFWLPAVFAQDSVPEEDDGSSERVEQSDDSYRRQMELEDARARDRTYVDSTYGQPAAELEKIDKLPQESRDNIRDQLVDVIMENGEWEPSDVLEEYPYVPTAAAQSDPELKQQEQEAWDEQIEKYHAREAAAFGAHRGPVPGPGNPTGQQGGQQGDGQQQGQQGGQDGSGKEGGGESGNGSAGTYQPNKSSSRSSEDEVSTAGVSESALDFLRGNQRQSQPPPGSETQQEQAEAAMDAADQAAQQQAQQTADESAVEQQAESTQDVVPDTRGIIAIKDLDKLEGTEVPPDPDG